MVPNRIKYMEKRQVLKSSYGDDKPQGDEG